MNISVKKYTDKKITVEYMEGGTGKTVLFLPGGIRSGVYEENIMLLMKHFHVVVPELPGFGNATVPQSVWGLEEYGAFFKHFITSLGLINITVIGHSLGGGTALVLGRICPAVKKVILFGAAGVTPPFSRSTFLYNLFFKKTYYDFRHAKTLSLKAILLNNAVSTIAENARSAFHLARIAEKCIYNNLKDLDKIHVPVILLWGDKDELFPLSSAQKIKKTIPRTDLQIVTGNHDWCVLYPQKSTDLLLRYLSSS
jgi:abhydrolase domain-containing protein 6